ncbi:IS3 family transposase [Enterococcus faecium]|uniref:IS3 family transposase n=1 Tax=Enterococcus faecium TaxID=1352 RepID=UPI000CFCC865|nr:IS3 family transposase [Enterococcus faecium]PQV96205.1 hypothetical protein CWC50_08740 [Enterococcus faecium]
MSKRTRRTFSQEFKQQIVNLYLAGKPRVEIIREYELTASAFDKWVKQSKTSGSFKEKDNLTPEQNAVAESTYKSLKVEFVYQYTFETLQQLDLELFDYVNWWNHLRLHGTLGYETPVGYRNQRLVQ